VHIVYSLSCFIILSLILSTPHRRTSSKADRIKEYLATADVPDLTAEEMQAIDDAGAKLHKRVFARAVFGEES
jgi:diketogulonate reductase-like aldo/keto reductase